MTKFAKMSLVAALAIAGTTASAGSLEDAVKNTDVSGKVYVEFQANDLDAGTNETVTDLDFDITFKTKVNDNVTSVVRVQADNEVLKDAAAADHTVTLDNLYFVYANGPLTAMLGKMDINTPNTDGEQGNGILATYGVGPVTLVGASFTQTEVLGSDVSAAAVLGSIGPVNAELWYVSTNDADHWTGVVSGSVDIVSLSARYATTNPETGNDGSTLKLTAGVDLSPVKLKAGFLKTGEDAAATVTDPSSANTYELVQLGGNSDIADVQVWNIGASFAMDKMTYSLDYAALENDAGTVEENEWVATAKYQMSSNFYVQARYSSLSDEDTPASDNNSARLEAKYSF